MSNAAARPRVSVEDYLAGEADSTVKHEYVVGEVFAIAGANEAHVTWVLHAFTDQDDLELASLDFRCPLDSVYEDVDL